MQISMKEGLGICSAARAATSVPSSVRSRATFSGWLTSVGDDGGSRMTCHDVRIKNSKNKFFASPRIEFLTNL
jgi:hypothetical protein